jgi:tRNA 2-thiocytidine biosynthesis protein TtcA
MLRDWEKLFPGRIESMFSALQNVVPSHLLDGKRHDFKGIKATGEPDEDGDLAFDPETFPAPTLPGLSGLTGLKTLQPLQSLPTMDTLQVVTI